MLFQMIRQVLLLTVISLILPACKSETGATNRTAKPDTVNAQVAVNDVLEKAIAGMGGRVALENLHVFSVDATRDRYVLGLGPEPDRGVFRGTVSGSREIHDLAGGRIRLDYTHTNLYGFERDVSELIIGQAGYVMGRDNFYYDLGPGKAMEPSRWGMTGKTERLINPHYLLKELLQDDSLASLGTGEQLPRGVRLSPDQVYPVTLYFGLISGQRKLIVDQAWLKRWHGSRFKDLVAEELIEDSAWLSEWQADRDIDTAAHYQLVVADDIYPITLFIDKQNGRINKLATMEHDIAMGDVPLEVTYHDWQSVASVDFPMRIKLSLADAPILDVKRSTIAVNPAVDEPIFTPPEGAAYKHDEDLASRGARVSQWVIAIAHGGSPDKPLGHLKIEPKEIAPGIYLVFSTPDEAARTLLIELENGFVVSDPGFMDRKSESVIAWLEKHYPGKPVTHLVATHHHVDHVAGMRPYIAGGAKLVAHEAAKEYYVKYLHRSKATIMPDVLDESPVEAEVIAVEDDGSYRIDDPVRPVTVYPVLNRHSSDMVMVYLDNEKFIYNGDLYSVTEEPDEAPGNGWDLYQSILSHDLKPEMIIGSHGPASDVAYEAFAGHVTGRTGRPQVDVDTSALGVDSGNHSD